MTIRVPLILISPHWKSRRNIDSRSKLNKRVTYVLFSAAVVVAFCSSSVVVDHLWWAEPILALTGSEDELPANRTMSGSLQATNYLKRRAEIGTQNLQMP